MRLFKAIHKQERGMILIQTLIVLVLSSLMLPPLLSFMGTGITAAKNKGLKTQELYAAEAGVEHAMWMIESNGSSMPGYQAQPYLHTLPVINGKNVSYSIAFVDVATYEVTSVATDTSSTTTIEAYISVPQGGIFANAVTSLNGSITLNAAHISSSPVAGDGSIYANGSIVISGSTSVGGNATATGSISAPSGAVSGTSTAQALPESSTPVSTALYLYQANQGTLIKGNYTVSSASSLGPALITGDLTVQSHGILTLTGTVWVDGNITVQGGGTIKGAYTIVSASTDPNNAINISGGSSVDVGLTPFFIATNGGVTISGNSTVYAVIYAPQGKITVSGGATIQGCIAGQSDEISGGSNVLYPSNLQQVRTLPGGNVPKVLTWQITQ